MRRSPFTSLSLSMRLAAATLAAALAVPSCSHDSYLVVTLTSADTAFSGVSWVDVDVTGDGVSSPTLSYNAREPISFTTTMGVTLSVSFTPSRSGNVTLSVTARDSNRVCVGRGTKTGVMIKKGDVATAAVQLRHDCTGAGDGGLPPDGGAPDGSVTFPGCDPANPAAMCKAAETCFVNCSTRMGMCIAGGTKRVGETCSSNADCMPGTQCFDYSGVTGCASGTRVCLKFCSNDGMCNGGNGGNGATTAGTGGAGVAGTGGAGGGNGATGGAAGANGAAGSGVTASAIFQVGETVAAAPSDLPPSACRNPVACSATVTTSYRTCSFGCDPRGEATLGCPTGLRCFLYRDPLTGKDNPDCGCKEPTRLKTDGMTCAGADECATGHVCNMMGGTQTCRKLCKIGVAGDCASPQNQNKVCQPLTGTAYGVCI